MLSEIKSETKLNKIFQSERFDRRLLKVIIEHSFERIVSKFKHDCLQHTPHLNYLKIPLILKQAIMMLIGDMDSLCSVASTRMRSKRTAGNINMSSATQTNASHSDNNNSSIGSHLCIQLTQLLADDNFTSGLRIAMQTNVTLMRCIDMLEQVCLVHIEAQFVEKFIKENVLKPAHHELFIRFSHVSAAFVQQRLAADATRGIEHCDDIDNNVARIDGGLTVTSARASSDTSHRTDDSGWLTNNSIIMKNNAELDEIVVGLKCTDALLGQKYLAARQIGCGATGDTGDAGRLRQQQQQHMTLVLDVVHTAMAKYFASNVFYNKYVLTNETIATCYCPVAMPPLHVSDVGDNNDGRTSGSCLALCKKTIAIAKAVELCMDVLNNCMYDNDRYVNATDEAKNAMSDDNRHLINVKVRASSRTIVRYYRVSMASGDDPYIYISCIVK